ncbi:crossover junction endonuclease MUS81-like [Liolophura sinensis]|uniref:crossover junction endonuclease MUS81-like n=1 Tax=Liolophura sinensis TaxID=3198878 RepID=UPI0031580E0A
MDIKGLKGKRKKKKNLCPNPLFVQWLTEWRDEAAEKGMKSQYCYRKALASLKKYPLVFTSGKECKVLENFGDKICKMLDARLAKHISEHGDVDDIAPPPHKPAKCVPTRDVTGSPCPASVIQAAPTSLNIHSLSDSDEDPSPLQPRSQRQSSGEYIPAYRSGPYAILLTLYSSYQRGNGRGYMTRADLTREAQHLADKSFTVPDPGCRYTAWSSMGTLIRKGLVIKESSPARYTAWSSMGTLIRKGLVIKESSPARYTAWSSLGTLIRKGLVIKESSPARYTAWSSMGTLIRKGLVIKESSPVRYTAWSSLGTLILICPGCRYTAWSSMGTLIRKGLVIKESSPARYFLTQNGCDLAHKLSEVNDAGTAFKAPLSPAVVPSDLAHSLREVSEAAVVPSGLSLSPSFTGPVTSGHETFTAESDLPRLPSLSGETSSALQNWAADRFQYWYVTESGSKTVDKNKAAVTVNDSIGIGFLITCNYQDLIKSGKKYKLDISRPLNDDNIFAYLEDSAAKDFANTPPEIAHSRTPEPSTVVPEPSTVVPEKRKVCQKDISKTDNKFSKNTENTYLTTAKLALVGPVAEARGSSLSERLGLGVKPSPHTGTASVAFPCPMEGSALTHSSPTFSLEPGTFDILLCVDNQEFYGKTTSGGKTLLADLLKNGVNCEVRKLHVGDFAWVARERAPRRSGQLKQPEARELVLDHIIERKRMDDLVSSCIDGRFKEQKFRLKRCGLRCPMYLIEDYGSVQNFSMPEDRLRQTIANTQIVDGFQVKRTGDNKESVAFLTLMTRYLQSHYQDKTLDAFPADILPDISGPYNIKDPHQRLMEFKEFNEASVKTKNLSIREMFGKQIIQMYRLSAEGAKGILDLYPTPSSLIAAYNACCTEKEKEELLSKIKTGKAGRGLGMAVSRQFYNLYCTNRPLT